MKQHKIVIIGIGAIAEAVAQSIANLPNATLVGGSCRTEAKGQAFAQKYECRWYSDNDEMLERERPDVAMVTTPSGAHLDALLAAARHKVHVLCEKPLEITTARIRQMSDAARAAGITLGGIFPQRFNPVVQAIHNAVKQGRLGSVSVINATVPWWRKDAYYGPNRWQGTLALDGGGALMNQSIHYVDLVQWLAAATMPDLPADTNPVEEVFAYTAKRAHDPKLIEVEDTAVVTLRFRNGALGQILGATSMWPGAHRRLQIAGRDGTIELVEDTLQTWQFREQRPEDPQLLKNFATATTHHGGAANPMAFNYANHQHNLAAFLRAIEEGREPVLSATESAKAVRLIEAAYESARTGAPVRVYQEKIERTHRRRHHRAFHGRR